MSEQQNTLKIHRLPFTQVPNDLICSDKISGMAKALWCVFYSKPDNWTFYWREIENNFKEGRDAVRNAAKQLEELGYLKKTQKKINSGKGMTFGGMEIELFSYPNQQIKDSSSNTENPCSRNSDTSNSDSTPSNSRKAVTYKEIKNKDLSNKDLDNSFFSNSKAASKKDLENYGKEKKYLSDFEDFWIKNEATGWKGIENRYARYDGWELEHKKKYPEKHKITLNSANSESTAAQSEPIKINNDDPLWLKLSEILKSDFEKDVYEKWLSKLNFIHLKDGEMLLGTESKFLRDWIKREHLESLKLSFQQAEESLKSINIIYV